MESTKIKEIEEEKENSDLFDDRIECLYDHWEIYNGGVCMNHKNFRFVEEFFNEYSHLMTDKDYVKSLYDFTKKILKPNVKMNDIFTYRQLEGFILWNKNELDIWSSSWFNRGVLIMVDDHSYACDLPSLEVAEQKRKDNIKYDIYYLPHSVQRRWVEENSESDCCYVKIRSNDNHVCSRTELTHEELVSLRANMSPDEYKEHNENIEKAISKIRSNGLGLTKENPICIYMCGTDDTSFTTYTNNMKNANRIFEEILECPMMHTIKQNGFSFSN